MAARIAYVEAERPADVRAIGDRDVRVNIVASLSDLPDLPYFFCAAAFSAAREAFRMLTIA
jgi:hypothetical protein